MTCPFCQNALKRNEVEMWESFNCPHCYKLPRAVGAGRFSLLRLFHARFRSMEFFRRRNWRATSRHTWSRTPLLPISSCQ